MKGALAVFAKTQGLSPLKTRLAKGIGTSNAQTFYSYSVNAVTAVMHEVQKQSEHDLTPHWALAEEAATNLQQWQSFNTLWTGEGGLGERMHHVYQSLRNEFDYVILIGTDSPQINLSLINTAIEKLNQNPESCIFGPCKDGGFYLLAAQIKIPQQVWTQVTYSNENTLSEFVNKLAVHNIKTELLKPMQDVDTLDDMRALFKTLGRQHKSLLPAQKMLITWLKEYFKSKV